MSTALETTNLGKRYGRTWALRDCAVKLPAGRVAALVGPNGAGKTTLLQLAVGLLRPSVGEVRVFGRAPREHPLQVLPRVGFVAQEHPLYAGFTIADLLTMGHKLNSLWDQPAALARPAERPRHPPQSARRQAFDRAAGPGGTDASAEQTPGPRAAG